MDQRKKRVRVLDIEYLLKNDGKYQTIWEAVRSTFRLGAGTLEMKPQAVTDMTSVMIACALNEFHTFLEAVASDHLNKDQINMVMLTLLSDIKDSLAEKIAAQARGEDEDDEDDDDDESETDESDGKPN